jgi:hypothetical protein
MRGLSSTSPAFTVHGVMSFARWVVFDSGRIMIGSTSWKDSIDSMRNIVDNTLCYSLKRYDWKRDVQPIESVRFPSQGYFQGVPIESAFLLEVIYER